MAARGEPTYTDLVYEVLESAEQPLTFQEIFDAVNRRRRITTRDPKATIRNALTQGRQLITTSAGRYGYLPHLLAGSLLRQPLTEKKPANHPLVFPTELHIALWPAYFEAGKRERRNPVLLRLPNGDQVELHPEFGAGEGESPLPEGLRRYLVENRASAGDSLLVRVIDAEAGLYEARFEARSTRNNAAVAARDRELADAAEHLLRRSRDGTRIISELAVALLGQGAYRADVPPDTLETVLQRDPRFVEMGMGLWTLTELMTAEVEARIHSLKQFETDFLRPATEGVAKPTSVLASRYAMERTLADVGAALAGRDFASLEEANAFLKEINSRGGPPRRTPSTPLEKAQDLMYDAWESSEPRERIALAKKALKISPDCADAYVVLAEETADSPREAAALYAQGVAAGESALGEEAFRKDVGNFWGILETRPYMRARLGLAEALWEMGDHQKAIGHAWEMLRLNPGDNQGVRDLLVVWLLAAGDNADVQRLLDHYPGDSTALWAYSRLLHSFRVEGDSKRTEKLLAEARRVNRYVPAYLLGDKPLPKELPETVGFGDEREAAYCAAQMMTNWLDTAGAVQWLRQRAGQR
jgi:tetratricopeptide (TPR) repeat protein